MLLFLFCPDTLITLNQPVVEVWLLRPHEVFFFFKVANYKPIRIIERVIILIVLSDIETSIIL